MTNVQTQKPITPSEDDVLRRLLNTPHKPHVAKKAKKKAPKPAK